MVFAVLAIAFVMLLGVADAHDRWEVSRGKESEGFIGVMLVSGLIGFGVCVVGATFNVIVGDRPPAVRKVVVICHGEEKVQCTSEPLEVTR